MYKSVLNIILLIASSTLIWSCVDNDLDIPDTNDIQTSESSALISFLNSYDDPSGSIATNSVSFIFPIYIAYTNGLIVEVTNEEGLNSIIQSQSSSFYINEIKFPVEVSISGNIEIINNESDFNLLLDELSINSFEDDFIAGFLRCYDFDYPSKVNNNTFSNSDDFLIYISSKPDSSGFKLTYPLQLIVYNADSIIIYNNEYEVLELATSCEECPQLGYTIRSDSTSNYTFIADTSLSNFATAYQWFINGEFIENDGPDYQGDGQLSWVFQPGQHEICMIGVSEASECNGIDFCQTIFVEDLCPQLHFTRDSTENSFTFRADFFEMDSISYNWELYQNGDLIASELEDENGDNQFFYQFSRGNYSICLTAETPECPQGSSYCEEVIIQ
ncbi:hypothetical protein [Marinigracilibium pacificum]|uniref:PKD domain-containing protein n=1 Tax=Marinigracilibium pacificum TaxID=2729599 RepID=A0A848IYL5_9BACT|nr:hypothetical protein [Marinigracilibium pacificum]NMM49603.1 hypothetical protein [Marinigracilibium pacificum]